MGNTRMTATIVIPCYNEANRLPVPAFQEFMRNSPDIRFLFVNDGSRDATLEVLRKLCAGSTTHTVLDLPANGGKAEAVRAGMLAAIAQHQAGIVGFWDADLATPLSAIHDLLAIMEQRAELQFIFGARVKLLGRDIRRRPMRHYLGRIFATAASLVLRLPIYDTQCGAKLFRVTPELGQILADRFRATWVFDVELIARYLRLPTVRRDTVESLIYEFPLYAWEDVAGSKLRPKDFLRAILDLYRIYREG
jgi:glycosyltransferase involved in cell wall biosynthesis